MIAKLMLYNYVMVFTVSGGSVNITFYRRPLRNFSGLEYASNFFEQINENTFLSKIFKFLLASNENFAIIF